MKQFWPKIREVRSQEEINNCADIFTGSEPWISLGITKNAMIKTLNDPLHEVFVVENDKQIVGAFVLQTKGAFTGYIKSIALNKGWRGKGLGEMMMKFIENKIFMTSQNVFLCVSSFNKEAQRFYQKQGYKNIGLLKDYIVKGYDEVLMRKTKGPLLGS